MNDIELFEIYDIWYQPPWVIHYFFPIMVTFVIGILGVMALYWYKRRVAQRKKYWQITLERLAKLDRTDHKAFYFSLTSILKEYLIERYALDVYGKTDLEMVVYLENTILAHEQVEDLKKIFNETTCIKFSMQDVDDSVVQQHLCLSMQVVKNTVPKDG